MQQSHVQKIRWTSIVSCDLWGKQVHSHTCWSVRRLLYTLRYSTTICLRTSSVSGPTASSGSAAACSASSERPSSALTTRRTFAGSSFGSHSRSNVSPEYYMCHKWYQGWKPHFEHTLERQAIYTVLSTVIIHLVNSIDEDHQTLLPELRELRVRLAEHCLERAPQLLEAARNFVLADAKTLVPQSTNMKPIY